LVVVVARHTLGYVVGLLRLDWLVPFHRGLLGHAPRSERYTRAEHVRMAVEELGVTAVKMGQILSTRGDVLAPAYQRELVKLQDAAPPERPSVILAVVEAELGCSIEAVFVDFDPEPLAAASIGQAHAATLADGTDVVVKVRRPGVVEQVELELDVLASLSRGLARVSRRARRHDLVGLDREFSETLRSDSTTGSRRRMQSGSR
jgi:ubiquinone biosynthesis protein